MNMIVKTLLDKTSAFAAAGLIIHLCASPSVARAEKSLSRVTPQMLKPEGFSIQIENQKDGTVRFTLARDLSKARSFPADSGLQVSRYAKLTIVGRSGLLATCELAPNARDQQGTITYRFTLAGECVAHSSLTVAEDDDYKDQTREHLIGGGTRYEFDLALFAQHQSAKKGQE
jgi:hypothetical protein